MAARQAASSRSITWESEPREERRYNAGNRGSLPFRSRSAYSSDREGVVPLRPPPVGGRGARTTASSGPLRAFGVLGHLARMVVFALISNFLGTSSTLAARGGRFSVTSPPCMRRS